MSQGNEGNEGVVTSEFRRQNATRKHLRWFFSGSAGDNNEGGAGTFEKFAAVAVSQRSWKRRPFWTPSLPLPHPL